MTHRERLIEILTEASIVYREIEAEEADLVGDRLGLPAILVEAGTGPRNQGYMPFFSLLAFDESGHLEAWGTWE